MPVSFLKFSTAACEWVGDVVGVVTPLGGVAQVSFHGVKVVEVGVVLRVHQDRGVEEDGEGQVEVEREEGEVKENHTCMKMGWSEDLKDNLSQWGACAIKVWRRNSALYVPYSLVQLARVVVVRVILVDVICVMLVDLIAHVDVVAVYAIFV